MWVSSSTAISIPYSHLLVVDFSVVPLEELERNYTTRGGKLAVKSRECEVQEQRELTTLMVIYTTPSDIPPSPREPSDPYSGGAVIEQTFGSPGEETKVSFEPNFAKGNYTDILPRNEKLNSMLLEPIISTLLIHH